MTIRENKGLDTYHEGILMEGSFANAKTSHISDGKLTWLEDSLGKSGKSGTCPDHENIIEENAIANGEETILLALPVATLVTTSLEDIVLNT